MVEFGFTTKLYVRCKVSKVKYLYRTIWICKLFCLYIIKIEYLKLFASLNLREKKILFDIFTSFNNSYYKLPSTAV